MTRQNRGSKGVGDKETVPEDDTATHTINDWIGSRGILLEDLPNTGTQDKGLPFTEEDQDIHHRAALIFIQGHTKLRKDLEDGTLNPNQENEGMERLKAEYIKNITGMSKAE